MSASALRREIEMVLGLSAAQAVALWQAALAVKPSTAAGYDAFDPRFVGGVFVGSPAADKGRLATTPSAPGPVPIPYPNFSAGGPAAEQSARHLVAGHKFTLERHLENDLIRCVLAASQGDAAEAQARMIWLKTRRKLEVFPAQSRNALGLQLVQRLRQGGG